MQVHNLTNFSNSPHDDDLLPARSPTPSTSIRIFSRPRFHAICVRDLIRGSGERRSGVVGAHSNWESLGSWTEFPPSPTVPKGRVELRLMNEIAFLWMKILSLRRTPQTSQVGAFRLIWITNFVFVTCWMFSQQRRAIYRRPKSSAEDTGSKLSRSTAHNWILHSNLQSRLWNVTPTTWMRCQLCAPVTGGHEKWTIIWRKSLLMCPSRRRHEARWEFEIRRRGLRKRNFYIARRCRVIKQIYENYLPVPRTPFDYISNSRRAFAATWTEILNRHPRHSSINGIPWNAGFGVVGVSGQISR